MADTNVRIEQFRKMAADDPNNELAHFSLGRAYLDAGQFDVAGGCFERALALNPQMSRAYQLLGLSLQRSGRREQAIEALGKGIVVANDRGDLAPRNEMMEMLREMGAAAPELKLAEVSQAVGADQVLCHRCARVGGKLTSPPFKSALGREIQEKICQACWREWVAMGTKVINELRLSMVEPESQRIFNQHMREFLNLG